MKTITLLFFAILSHFHFFFTMITPSLPITEAKLDRKEKKALLGANVLTRVNTTFFDEKVTAAADGNGDGEMLWLIIFYKQYGCQDCRQVAKAMGSLHGKVANSTYDDI